MLTCISIRKSIVSASWSSKGSCYSWEQGKYQSASESKTCICV